jgi:hypothetical protein
LGKQPILWLVPEDIQAKVEQAGLSREKIIQPRSLEPVEFQGLRITPFCGLHWENDPGQPDGLRGVPAVGYLVEFNGKRWLFPGDIRTYDLSLLPSFGAVDGAFVHLWLGRASALLEEPPLLESFCRFCQELNSRRIIITHLQEFGREVHEFWDGSHFQQVKQCLRGITPGILAESAGMGDCVNL